VKIAPVLVFYLWTSTLVFVYRRGLCELGETDAVNRQSLVVWC